MEVYLNNAATSWPKPEKVYVAVDNYLRNFGASQGRGSFRRSREATGIIEECRARLARLFNADDPSRFVFTKNCSEALNLAIKGLLRKGDHVITSSMEHNSVWRPLKTLEMKGVISLTEVVCNQRGEIDLAAVEKAFQPNTRLLVCTHASNVTGTLFPIAELAEIAHQHNAVILVDAAQTAGVYPIDIKAADLDLIAFSGHKGLLGPQGTGAFYISRRLTLEPLLEGGTGSSSLSPFQPEVLPDRFETGTPNGPGIAGLGAALDFILETGIEVIRQKEEMLTGMILEKLQEIAGIELYGVLDPERQVAVISFNVRDVDPKEVGTVLDEVFGIMVRTGLHCAPEAHKTIGTIERGTVRVSPGFFNTPEEIEYFIEAMREIARKAGYLTKQPEKKDDSGEYVVSYRIQQISPCFFDNKKIRVVASLPRDITELFPYLNAVLRGYYSEEGRTFTFSYEGRLVVLQHSQITLSKTEDINEAQVILDKVLTILNKVASEREQIIPTTKPQINPFVLYKHMPRTNCRECGELTCFAFATGVILGQYEVEQCPVLNNPLYKRQKEIIEMELKKCMKDSLPSGEEFAL